MEFTPMTNHQTKSNYLGCYLHKFLFSIIDSLCIHSVEYKANIKKRFNYVDDGWTDRYRTV